MIKIHDIVYDIGDFYCPFNNSEYRNCQVYKNVTCPIDVEDDDKMYMIGEKVPCDCPLRSGDIVVGLGKVN